MPLFHRALKIEILKRPDQCNNNDFLPGTIRYMDNVKGVEITLVENRERIIDAERKIEKARAQVRRDKKEGTFITVITYDEWIAQNYLD